MNTLLRILVVDDERLSRLYIQDLVKELDAHALVFEARNATEAIAIFEQHTIDILFSDIRMPKNDGFDLLQQLSHRNFELVFITAYSQYALQAIKENVADYLLKPLQKDEFADMYKRVCERVYARRRKSLNSDAALSDKLALSHSKGIKFMSLQDIVYLEGANTYTTLVLANGERVLSSKPISRFEQTLNADWFFRIHKSYLINIFHFQEYISYDGDYAKMSNQDKLNISRYRLSEFLKRVQDMTGRLKI